MVPKEKIATTTENEYCTPRALSTGCWIAGMTAPPEVAAVIRDAAVLV
jgi:hypothetical protein